MWEKKEGKNRNRNTHIQYSLQVISNVSGYLVQIQVLTNWPIEKALHEIGYKPNLDLIGQLVEAFLFTCTVHTNTPHTHTKTHTTHYIIHTQTHTPHLHKPTPHTHMYTYKKYAHTHTNKITNPHIHTHTNTHTRAHTHTHTYQYRSTVNYAYGQKKKPHHTSTPNQSIFDSPAL